MLNTIFRAANHLVEFASFDGLAIVPDLFVPGPFDMSDLAVTAQPFVNAIRNRRGWAATEAGL